MFDYLQQIMRAGLQEWFCLSSENCYCYHHVKSMSANMLTEQNVIMEFTDSSDTVPIGFLTMDDGTLFAMGGKRAIMFNILKHK